MKLKNIEIPVTQIAALCDRWHIQKLSLFGSVLRDDFTPDSDIDVLVAFEACFIPGFLKLHQKKDGKRDRLDCQRRAPTIAA